MTKDVWAIAEAINRARPETDETDGRVVTSLYRLLGRGKPVADADLSSVTGLTKKQIVKRVGKWPGVYRDERGRVIGFWGLSVAEMAPHEIIHDGHKLWAWCAWDTLFLPQARGVTRCSIRLSGHGPNHLLTGVSQRRGIGRTGGRRRVLPGTESAPSTRT